MTPCELIIRNAYASPYLRGQRARISRWERAWWTRVNRVKRAMACERRVW